MARGYVWDFPTSKGLQERLRALKTEYKRVCIEVHFILADDFPGRFYNQESRERLARHAELELEIESIENKLKKFI